ncbi:MAG: TRAP transporter substrate-binding protein [Alkalilacustris sp.]
MKQVILGTVAAVALTGAAHAQQSLVIGHALSPSSHYGLGAQAFLDTLEELSGGAFTGEQAPAGQLGGERDMIEGLQIGSLDLVITSTGPLGNFVPEVLALDLPFLFRDYDHARAVLDGDIGQELLDQMRDADLVGLAWTENGFRHVTNSRRPVTAPEHMEGLTLRTMENRVHMAAFEGIGASPTPMAFPEVFGALQQGVIDGQENPITVITAARFWEVQRYVTLTGHVYSPAIVLASPILFDSLTEEEQGWFLEAARVSAAATRAEVDRLEEEGIALLLENGMEVITEIDRDAFQTLAAEASWPVFTDRFGTEMLERIVAVE